MLTNFCSRSNIAVDIKIKVVTAVNDVEVEETAMPSTTMLPTLRKTGVGMMNPLETVIERQQSELTSHVAKFTTKFRKRSNSLPPLFTFSTEF